MAVINEDPGLHLFTLETGEQTMKTTIAAIALAASLHIGSASAHDFSLANRTMDVGLSMLELPPTWR